MPNPMPRETKEQFLNRCIPIVNKESKTKNLQQACAICFSYWERREQVSENIYIQYIHEIL